MDDKKFQIEVLERLTAIETTLKQQDYKAINEKISSLDKQVVEINNKTNNNGTRLDKIEDNTKWLWRTIAGSIITVVIGAIIAIIKMS